MKDIEGIKYYSLIEEKINIISHAIGLNLSIVALVFLVTHSIKYGDVWNVFVGVISYTIGAILYSIKKIKFNHAIFHMFVLIGSFCHFMSVFFYVLPRE